MDEFTSLMMLDTHRVRSIARPIVRPRQMSSEHVLWTLVPFETKSTEPLQDVARLLRVGLHVVRRLLGARPLGPYTYHAASRCHGIDCQWVRRSHGARGSRVFWLSACGRVQVMCPAYLCGH